MNPLRFRVSALALVSVVLLAACSNTPSGDMAATVNGSTITNAQVQHLEPALAFLSTLSQQPCGGSTAPGASPAPSNTTDCNRQTLDLLIQAEVVKPYAAQHKLTVTDTQITDAVNQLVTGMGGQAAFDKKLAEAKVTSQSFRDLVEPILLLTAVQKGYGAPTQQELQALYDKSKAQFTMIDTAHILLKTQAEALKIKKQATTKNFAALAKKYSTDTGSASKGGELGSVSASQLVSEYSNAVLAAKPGQIIGPVKSQFGYHVIWVKKITVQPFDQVKSQLAQSASGTAFQKWMLDQLKSDGVKVNPRYGRMDPATGQIVPISSTAVSSTPTLSPTP